MFQHCTEEDNKTKGAKIMSSKAIFLTMYQVLVHLGYFLNYLLKLSGYHLLAFDITRGNKQDKL